VAGGGNSIMPETTCPLARARFARARPRSIYDAMNSTPLFAPTSLHAYIQRTRLLHIPTSPAAYLSFSACDRALHTYATAPALAHPL